MLPRKQETNAAQRREGKRANLFVCLRRTAAEVFCHPALSYGSQPPTNTCLMTPFIHSVTISSSLPLFFCPLMAHMHLSVFLPNGIFKLWAYGLTSYLVSGACGRNCPTTNSGQGSLGVPSDVVTKGSLVF